MSTKYVIGYDLNDLVSQISYFELNNPGQIPESIAGGGEEEQPGIPTVLSKRKGVSQWDYGNAAKAMVKSSDASLVTNLLSIASTGARIELEGDAYDATELLILFVRRSLNSLAMIMSPEDVECMIITVESLEGNMLDVVEKVAMALPISRDRIIIQSYEESIFYYLLHQPSELWDHDVAVFDYSGNCLEAYEMWMNRRCQPVVSFVDRTQLKDIRSPKEVFERDLSEGKEARLDEKIRQTLKQYFDGKNVGTVFLLGAGFEGGWCDGTLKYLCMGKRVFQGRNLYSKGACYSAHDRIQPCDLNSEYVFLGADKLKLNVGIKMIVRGQEEYMALADAGTNWYKAEKSYEFILGNEKEVSVLLTPLDGKNKENVTIDLSSLPERPARASRLKLTISFISQTRLCIRIEDRGFGEFYPATGKVWEKLVDMA